MVLKLLHVRTSAEVMRRIHSERQTLARMDHPNVAKVLDAGATDRSEPYRVMELIAACPGARRRTISG